MEKFKRKGEKRRGNEEKKKISIQIPLKLSKVETNRDWKPNIGGKKEGGNVFERKRLVTKNAKRSKKNNGKGCAP